LPAAAFSADGRYVAAGGIFSQITVWELASGQAIVTLPSRDPMFAFSPDARTLATCGQSSAVHLWDIATGEERRVLHHPGQAVAALAFSADGSLLATGSRSGVIRVWDAVKAQEKLAATTSIGGNPIAFLPKRHGLVLDTLTGLVFYDIAAPARGVKAWSVKEQQRLTGFHGQVAPDGKTMACVDAGRNIVLWDIARNIERRHLGQSDHIPGMPGFAYAPDSQTLAIASPRGIELVDVVTGKSARILGEPKGFLPALAFTPDGKTLITADNALRYLDVKTGKEIRQAPIPSDREHDFDRYELLSMRISPGGNVLAINGRSRKLQLWDLAKATTIGLPKTNGPFAFSPDGQWLATTEASNIHLWELATGKMFAELYGTDGPITSLLFAPDGHVLATGSAGHTTLLWDVRLPRLFAAPEPSEKWDDAERKRAWGALAGLDTMAAYQAMTRLSADPTNTVALLEARLAPVVAPPAKQVRHWIADLDSVNFETRDQASTQLKKLGTLAKPALQTALKAKPDLEVKRRLEALLAQLGNEEIEVPAGDTLRTLRAIQLLEILGTPAARRLLDRLAGGVEQALQTRRAHAALRRWNHDPQLP
jgi:WD40 repeat protein